MIRVYIGEVFPTDIRSLASGLAMLLCTVIISISGLLYPLTVELMGIHGTFWGYMAVCLANLVYCYFSIFDSKGKSLVNLEERFDK